MTSTNVIDAAILAAASGVRRKVARIILYAWNALEASGHVNPEADRTDEDLEPIAERIESLVAQGRL